MKESLNGYHTIIHHTVSFDIKFSCGISEEGDVNSFVDCYIKEKNETIELKCHAARRFLRTQMVWKIILESIDLEENLFYSAHPSRFLFPNYCNHYFKSTFLFIVRATRTYKTSMCFSFIRNLVGKSLNQVFDR